MKRIATILTAAVLGALLAPSPAVADEAPLEYRFAATTICVMRTDAAQGWRIGAAIRAWNDAQDVVQLSTVAVPGCGVIEIREYDDPASDWNGYTTWPRISEGQLMENGRWGYHHAEVWLNHPKLVESFKPRYKGTDRGCWRKRVVAHELGHALGLMEHTTGPESVMSYEHDYATFCGSPSASDADALAALYG